MKATQYSGSFGYMRGTWATKNFWIKVFSHTYFTNENFMIFFHTKKLLY